MRLFIHHHLITACVLGVGGLTTIVFAIVRGF